LSRPPQTYRSPPIFEIRIRRTGTFRGRTNGHRDGYRESISSKSGANTRRVWDRFPQQVDLTSNSTTPDFRNTRLSSSRSIARFEVISTSSAPTSIHIQKAVLLCRSIFLIRPLIRYASHPITGTHLIASSAGDTFPFSGNLRQGIPLKLVRVSRSRRSISSDIWQERSMATGCPPFS